MSSRIAQVVEDAAAEIEATGHVAHLYTTCERAGWVNASGEKSDDQGPPCTACQLVEIGAEIVASKRASS